MGWRMDIMCCSLPRSFIKTPGVWFTSCPINVACLFSIWSLLIWLIAAGVLLSVSPSRLAVTTIVVKIFVSLFAGVKSSAKIIGMDEAEKHYALKTDKRNLRDNIF